MGQDPTVPKVWWEVACKSHANEVPWALTGAEQAGDPQTANKVFVQAEHWPHLGGNKGPQAVAGWDGGLIPTGGTPKNGAGGCTEMP